MADKPRCTATTNAGNRCKSAPQHGKEVCLAHDQEARESGRFGGAQPNAGRPANPKPSEIARKLIEENVLALQRPYWNTLGYDVLIGDDGPYLVRLDAGGAKLYGTSKDGYVSMSEYEDMGAMMAAAEKLQDRVYGRPKQQTEVTGKDGGPVVNLTAQVPADAVAKSAKAAALLAQHGLLDANG